MFVTTNVGGLPLMIGYVGTDPTIAANQVFTISLDATTTIDGTYTFTLLRPLDHPIIGTDDTLNLTVNITATDGSGDHVDTVIHVNVNDDTPVIVTSAETHSTLTDPVETAAIQSGSLGISWGADRYNDHLDGGVSATTGQTGDRFAGGVFRCATWFHRDRQYRRCLERDRDADVVRPGRALRPAG